MNHALKQSCKAALAGSCLLWLPLSDREVSLRRFSTRGMDSIALLHSSVPCCRAQASIPSNTATQGGCMPSLKRERQHPGIPDEQSDAGRVAEPVRRVTYQAMP